ncbi:hypothetical protein [Achromobacter insolitus]|uniref:hypothetical protein n=1 Tax=Achromobacter insolitus TaxID=217204 RepID=UPI0028B1D115|nr:hypothetical protein [Achromobacter insolitus]
MVEVRNRKKAVGGKVNGFLNFGVGLESNRLAAGDFELAIYSVSTGKWGEF